MSAAQSWPEPSPEALATSAALADEIRATIEREGGWIGFARFMELALYAPGRGYYSAGSTKIGAAGDFVTAPELGTLFGRALAATLRADLAALPAPAILELGAGAGSLAEQLLDALGDLPLTYLILEPSADLAARQRARLARFGARVAWLDRLPEAPFAGAVVANEVLDALPVSCFTRSADGVLERGVAARGAGFEWAERPAGRELAAAVEALERKLGARLPAGYRSEVCLALPAFVAALGAALERGPLLIVDYGLVRREYYHAQRTEGTLVCHYRHRAHADPFFLPGLQDISAWVDFSATADAAAAAGLDVAGFTTQAQFLLATLATLELPATGSAAALRELAALKTLVLPGEMGERFKVLLLRKGGAGPALPGRDLRDRL